MRGVARAQASPPRRWTRRDDRSRGRRVRGVHPRRRERGGLDDQGSRDAAGHADAFLLPVGLDARGTVIGESLSGPPGHQESQAFVWQRCTMTVLAYGRSSRVDVAAINAGGDGAGDAVAGDGSDSDQPAILWRNDRPTVLGTLGGRAASAVAMHAFRRDADGERQPARHRPSSRWKDGPTSIARRRPGDRNGARRSRRRVGYGPTPGSGRRSFVWHDGHATLLPAYDGRDPPWGGPGSISDDGQAIGTSYVKRGRRSFQHAVLWTVH